jgi:hypothetical protein
MIRFQSLLHPVRTYVARRRVQSMQLDPEDFGESNWNIIEKIWNSRVIVDSSTDLQHPPRSTMATRKFGPPEAMDGLLSTHIIPLSTRAEAEALSLTLLDRIKPQGKVTVQGQRPLEGVDLRGASNVRALERDWMGVGVTGREFIIVAVVENVAFGIGYWYLEVGWNLDRFTQVAQLQVDKIRSRVVAT